MMRSRNCTCLTIMNDPMRHFRECPDRSKIATVEGMQIAQAVRILTEGLKLPRRDFHHVPESVAREALEVLGVPREEQP